MPTKQKPRRTQRPLPRAETSWAADPLSDLVSAQELALWRRDPTSAKILRYLARWRGVLLEHMGEGGTTAADAVATALLTTEAVTQAQTLKDLLTLEARDIAQFYGLAEPKEAAEGKKH